jgi:plastocyanin
MTRAILFAAVLGGAVGATMASGIMLAQAQTGADAVGIDNFTFNPQQLTVKAGTTVIWTNKDDIPHAVAAVDRSFRSKTLDTGDSYTVTFTVPGTFKYFCSLHPHMTGTIVVEATN